MDARFTIVQWADVVIETWVQKMDELGVNDPYIHARSFFHQVHSNAGGDIAKIEFAFEYFLKFTDMAVGKGVTMANRGSVSTRRIPKQWFSKTFLLEVRKLANILAANFAHSGVLKVIENIQDNSIKE